MKSFNKFLNDMKSTRSSCISYKFLKNYLNVFFGGICCFIFLFIVILSIPVYLFRFLVILLAKLFRPDLDDILNSLSSCLVNDYFYNSKSPRASIIVSLVFQGRDMSIEELKTMLLERWVNGKDKLTGKQTFKQFTQYPVRWLGFTFYKKGIDTFDINNHVYLHDNTKDFVTDEDLNNICERLLNQPYKPFSSPWEVLLVNNYRSEKLSKRDSNSTEPRHVVIFKVHHSLADGFSMLNALVEGLGQTSLANVELPVAISPKRNFLEKLAFYACFPFRAFFEFSYALSHTFQYSPWKISNAKKEWYQFCTKSDYIPIQKVKFIKTKLGVSFTSVLMSAISSGIYQSLEDFKKKSCEKILETEENDSSMFSLCALPLPGHSKGLTNHVTAALFDLPIGKFNECVERLQRVNFMLESSKSSCMPFIVPLYGHAMGCHLYPVGKHLGMQRMSPLGLTNFPSVPIKIEDNGRRCISADFMAGGLDGEGGVGIMVLSYCGYIRIAVTAEKAVLSKQEVKTFMQNMMDEIDSLYNEACMQNNSSKFPVDCD